MTVYVDILLAVNYAVNLFLLLMAARLTGAVVGRKRLCLAALLGAVGSLGIFLPDIGPLFNCVYKVALTLSITAAAFGLKSRRRFIKGLCALMLCGFGFAGLMLALTLWWDGIMYRNGVIYFDISALELVFWTAVSYGALWVLERLFFPEKEGKELCGVTVDMAGKEVSFQALADTGNRLKEPFSGAPVMVCDSALTDPIFPQEPGRIRLIPCNTVSGDALLEAFRPDSVQICRNGKVVKTDDVYIAKSREPITGAYRGIFNPQIIE